MKTKALIPVIYWLDGNTSAVREYKTYMTEDGLFMVQVSPYRRMRYDLFINDCGWRFVTEVSTLRCARVWIKNFYRTLKIAPTECTWCWKRNVEHGAECSSSETGKHETRTAED